MLRKRRVPGALFHEKRSAIRDSQRLSEEIVKAVVEDLRRALPYKDIMAKYGITKWMINKIQKGHHAYNKERIYGYGTKMLPLSKQMMGYVFGQLLEAWAVGSLCQLDICPAYRIPPEWGRSGKNIRDGYKLIRSYERYKIEKWLYRIVEGKKMKLPLDRAGFQVYKKHCEDMRRAETMMLRGMEL
jgi:hypothetical protein